jgi:hypothetical protein
MHDRALGARRTHGAWAQPRCSPCSPDVATRPPPVVEPRPVKTILIELASASDVGAVTGEIKARTESLGHNLDPKTQYGNDFSVPNRFEIGR